jgi:polar amino acid transport system substrate-binding protein
MRLSKNKFLQLLAKIYVSILRGTPVLVLLMIIFYVVFASVNIEPLWIAVIAFGLNFGAYSSEIFRNGLASVQTGQHEASIALGFSKFQTFWHIVLPQAIRRILPVLKGEIITLVKMTSVVGYIAVQDLTKAGDIIRSRTFDAFFPLVMVAILYFAISWSLIFAIEFIEKKTDRRLRKRRAKR